MSTDRKTHLRIDFVVREVCDDGSVAEDDLKFVRFGDDIDALSVRDFFERCGHAMGLMFRGDGARTLAFVNTGMNKINVIKAVRELTHHGLKDAKDLVEAPLGTPILIVESEHDLKYALKVLTDAGAKVEARPYRESDSLGSLPLARYLRTT